MRCELQYISQQKSSSCPLLLLLLLLLLLQLLQNKHPRETMAS